MADEDFLFPRPQDGAAPEAAPPERALSQRELQLLDWLRDYNVHAPAWGTTRQLLRHWALQCERLCRERLPQVPHVIPKTYNRETGQMEPERDLGFESMAERIWPDVWRYAPAGHFLFVRRIPPAEMTSGVHGVSLHVPKSAEKANHRGWVLNVGPEVGDPHPSQVPYGCMVSNPLDLVGRVVSWGQYAGTPIVEQAIDARWDGEYLTISGGEILALELPLNPEEPDR